MCPNRAVTAYENRSGRASASSITRNFEESDRSPRSERAIQRSCGARRLNPLAIPMVSIAAARARNSRFRSLDSAVFLDTPLSPSHLDQLNNQRTQAWMFRWPRPGALQPRHPPHGGHRAQFAHREAEMPMAETDLHQNDPADMPCTMAYQRISRMGGVTR